MTTIADIQSKFLTKLESKLPGGNVTPQALKKALNFFDGDRDGIISLAEFLRCADGKLEHDEAEFLFMFWDSAAGEREPCGMVEIAAAVQDLLQSMPQFSTLLKGKDLANIAGQGRGNRSSQEGGIFGGGMYAAESERENVSARKNPNLANPQIPQQAMQANFTKPVNNQSSIEGGIFGEGAQQQCAPAQGARSNRSNQSSVQGGIFNQEPDARPVSNRGRNTNASSIPGGIFG